MKKMISILWVFSCLALFCLMFVCEVSAAEKAPACLRYDVTKGSTLSLDLSGYDFKITTKRPKVWLTGGALGKKRKMCKVIKFDTQSITCKLSAKVDPGQYCIVVKSGKATCQVCDRVFVQAPVIESISCSPCVPTTLTVSGKYFGSDVKVYLDEVNSKGKLKHWRISKKNIKTKAQTVCDIDPDKEGEAVSFTIPTNAANWLNGFVSVRNAIGTDTMAIARDADDYMIVDLATGAVATQENAPADLLTNDAYKTTSLVLRKVKAGTYTMGSPTDELGRIDNETQHEVTLTKDFYVGVFELTQDQFELVTGYNPSMNPVTLHPVENVTWDEARGGDWPVSDTGDISPAADSFLGLLNTLTGRSFDLPTDAQWEYACRATTTTALNSGEDLTSVDECPNMDAVGWYYYNSDGSHQIVGSLGTATAANLWGLYDMHGNVWEWCLDWYEPYLGEDAVEDPSGPDEGKMRVRRSGRWNNLARSCRSASRTGGNATYHWNANGMRVALTVE